MNTRSTPILTMLGGLAVGSFLLACDPPECIEGPSNLVPEATAACADYPAGVTAEDEIFSAGAEHLDDGTLVLTWSSQGLACGTRAADVDLPTDCTMDGWTMTAEIPAALIVPGVIDLSAHPEVIGSLTVLSGQDGISSGTYGSEPFFVGQIELVAIDGQCITGVLHSFGSGSLDPTLGGPELQGGFVAPVCDPPAS